MPVFAHNKKAEFDYEILERFEAGIVLLGHEVKSIKSGHVNLQSSYVTFRNKQSWVEFKSNNLPEAYLLNCQISLYKYASSQINYDPKRPRKLLLKKKEIVRLVTKKQEAGLTLIPVKIYTKNSFVKLELALAKGKKQFDKRETIKKRETERKLQSVLKRKHL